MNHGGPCGQLISFTDAESHTTAYTYASFFGLTKITYPDSTYEAYEYSNTGSVTSFTDAKGNEITFIYDSIYRLTQIQYQDQSTVSFTYDLNSNRIRMDDDAPSTGDYVEYAYDYWNRLITEERHISTDTYTVSYQYDEANRPTKLTYPNTTQILYSYDDLNRMTEIKRYVDGINDETLLDNVQYNTESLLTQFDYGNDLRATFSYDQLDRISTIDIKDGETSYLDLNFTYDNNSNITQLVNGWRDATSIWHSDTESYNYDGLDRLTSAISTSWSHTYSYDKVGNRTAKDGVTYTINTVNEVTGLSDGTSFTYDPNGNRTDKTKGTDSWVYTYDYANRLKKVEKNSAPLGEYIYDGDGKRLQVTENSETTTYTCTGLNVLYEENSTGSATYIYGPVGRLAKRTTINEESNMFYYHLDHLESTRLVTDDGKSIISAITYHPFGRPYTEEGSEDYLYTGKERDATELCYFGTRYYDSGIGRFITRDQELGRTNNPKTLNRYTYCFNNPLKYIDPDGRDPCGPDCREKNPTEGDEDFSLKGALLLLQLWSLSRSTKIMAEYGYWKADNNIEGDFLGVGVSLAGGVGGLAALIYGGYFSFVVGWGGAGAWAVVFVYFSHDSDFYLDMWCNDSQFVALFTTAETYAKLLMMGCDCEQEAMDAYVELQVYILQKKYGDDWRKHAQTSLLKYYDEMVKRRQPLTGGNGSDETPEPPMDISIT